jgi:hypothetical protein
MIRAAVTFRRQFGARSLLLTEQGESTVTTRHFYWSRLLPPISTCVIFDTTQGVPSAKEDIVDAPCLLQR